jgi:Cd2+/Zn2+-exporting ATPase
MKKLDNEKLVLDGLNCANCAAKIETSIKQMPDIEDVSLNFATKVLTFSIKGNKSFKKIMGQIIETVEKIEPDVIVNLIGTVSEEKQYSKTKSALIQTAIGTALFLVAIIFQFSVNLEFLLYLVSYLLIGRKVLQRAIKNISMGEIFDENFLMSIATICAFIIGEFAEGVAVMLFYEIGEMFQDMAVDRSRRSIADLLDIRPDFAALKIKNDIQLVSPEEVQIGDILLVKPGEKVPLDGLILEGSSTLDTSALTGESLPKEVFEGDTILSGSINQTGLLTIEVTKAFQESTVSKILDLVQNAANKKSSTENFITKFSKYYTPAVIAAAAIIAIIPPLLFKIGSFSTWIYRALIFLVISCPCALVISIPLGFFGGIGAASRNGILIKGSNYLDGLNHLNTIVFDKTGTLTKGTFKVTELIPENGVTKEDLLKYAALAESHSNHPIAHSIINAYAKNINSETIESYQEFPGYGIKVQIQEKEIIAGNSKLMDLEQISYSTIKKETGTIVYVAVDKTWIGTVIIADTLKKDASSTIKNLKNMGIQNIALLTGDTQSNAASIGKRLDINSIYAELLPHEKVEKLEELHEQKPPGKKIAFVGDGINDAPVIARADIGIAMGGLGSDAAIEAADIVLMTDEPSKLLEAIKIARKTKKIIWQNIYLAIGTKSVVLLMGALGMATMWAAVFADVGVALIAVLNAMRILRI